MNAFEISDILQVLPHRYPMLLVDRVIELVPDCRIVAIKNVTINEPFFPGHFPDNPIMPGVLIIEGMVQAGAILLKKSLPAEFENRICFAGIDEARFRKPVLPGDQLVFEVSILKKRSKIIKMGAKAFVNKVKVANAEIMAIIGGENDPSNSNC